MSRTSALLTGAGLGAGWMYFFDPKRGRQRRTRLRDKMIGLSHDLQDAREVVVQDARNRMRGLAAGDLTVLVGGKNALRGNPLRGGWSPTGRALLTLLGGGLFLRGLMREAPMACVLGTAGLALMIEGISNTGIEDIQRLSSSWMEKAAENVDHSPQRNRGAERAMAEATS
jgi:hypothetical protein